MTTKFYLHPVKGRNDAPAGLILISDRAEDDGRGAALIAVDPGNTRITHEQADAMAEEVCRRYNAANELHADNGVIRVNAIDYTPLRHPDAEADLPEFSEQSPAGISPDGLHHWINDVYLEFQDRHCMEIRVSVDDADKPTVALVEGWLIRPDPPPPPRFHQEVASNG